MNENVIKIIHKDSDFLEIQFWDNGPIYYLILIFAIAFVMPPFIIPVKFNLIASIYYISLIGLTYLKFSTWSIIRQKLIFDRQNNKIKISCGKPRTWINLQPLSQLNEINFLIFDHEEEKLEDLIRLAPIEFRIINIELLFSENLSFYFVTKNATSIYQWFQLREIIRSYLNF